MATNGIDATTAAAILTAMNGGTAFTITTPLRCLFHSAMRAADNTTDTEVVTSAGYTRGAGSIGSPGAGTPVALTFATATVGAPSAQASSVAVQVTNMPATTWAGNTITDSKATPRTTGTTGNTTNGSFTVTASDGAFLAADVGAVITGTNIPANTVIQVINSGTSVTISQAATGTATTTALTINRLNSPQTTWWAALASSKTVNAGDTVTVPSGSWQTSLA